MAGRATVVVATGLVVAALVVAAVLGRGGDRHASFGAVALPPPAAPPSAARSAWLARGAALNATAARYVAAWNARDVAALNASLCAGVALRDWAIAVTGRDAVVQANANIWRGAPKIRLFPLRWHVAALPAAGRGASVAVELLVFVNGTAPGPGDDAALKVVDVLEFDRDGRVCAVRAYRG